MVSTAALVVVGMFGRIQSQSENHRRFAHACPVLCVTARPEVVNDTCAAVSFWRAVPSGRAIQSVLMLNGSLGLSEEDVQTQLQTEPRRLCC